MSLGRLVDLMLALALLPLFGLAVPAFWMAGRMAGHESLFFRQNRVGRGGATLRILKFRTLGPAGREPRNSVFRVVRRLGIDELPQVLAVLRGEMSLVGPRPLLLEDLFPPGVPVDRRLWEAVQFRQSAKPGLTGVSQTLCQVRDRSGAYWTMLNGDLWYLQNRSARLDAAVLAVTAFYVLSAGRLRFPRHRITLDARRSFTTIGGPAPHLGMDVALFSREHVHVPDTGTEPLRSPEGMHPARASEPSAR